ncbi:MAG TPA: peptidoglycan DD-metalloendopeptidase family protein [Propionibacteriaceae bacterium]
MGITTFVSTRSSLRQRVALIAMLVSCALAFSVSAPANADDLTDQRDRVKQQLAKTKSDLNESSHALAAAGVAVDEAQNRLEFARDALAETQRELADARAKDLAMAAKLKKAKAELAAAKRAVIAGQAKLDAKKAMAGDMVRDQYQQQTNLLPIAILVESGSTADLQTRIQWSTTMFDTTQAKIDELTVIQHQLNAEKARQARLEAEVAADRQEAAANLKVKAGLELKAEQQEAAVTELVQQRQAVENAAADDVAQDKSQYAQLTKERASVETRIAARIAKEKAERRAAEKAAAQRAAAAARKAAARAAKASKQSPKRSSKKSPAPVRRPSSSSSGASSSGSSAHHGFAYPVSAPITSPYGMRFHPVLHYWKLHDGTDFGAGCGTAIRAPYPGRVAERYYNAGYGNRLMIDHGRVDGSYITTGYNHAIRYTVGVGQRVSKGQVIGYVGTTGFSTGCHLHLMVWKNGRVVNPMTWY